MPFMTLHVTGGAPAATGAPRAITTREGELHLSSARLSASFSPGLSLTLLRRRDLALRTSKVFDTGNEGSAEVTAMCSVLKQLPQAHEPLLAVVVSALHWLPDDEAARRMLTDTLIAELGANADALAKLAREGRGGES